MTAQPDIQALNAGLQQFEGGLQATRQQLGLLGNIPAIAGGHDILGAIADLKTTFDDGLTGVGNRLTGIEDRLTVVEDRLTVVENRLTGVENRLTIVETRITVVDQNQIARVQNTLCNASTSALHPLCHHLTGDPIALFPATVGAVSNMSSTDIDSVLADLGQSTTGAIAARHTHLLKAIGVHSQILCEEI